jgi:hypothetical protein
MSTQFKGQGRWVREVLNKFTALNEFQPEPMNYDPEWPEWVYNRFLMLTDISHPGAKVKNMKKWKAKVLGRFLGRQYAGEHLIRGQVPVPPQVIREGEKFAAWADKFAKQKLPGFDWDKFDKKNEPRHKLWNLKFKESIQETLASACTRPYAESSTFFEAFGKATVMKPNEFETERTLGVGDKICWTMIVMWQEIEQLRSVAELHRMFEKALKPQGVVVRYKRIEKLCQRVKLKFKDRGRPAGS